MSFSYPKFKAFDSDGNPLANGLLYTYESGTTTDKITYSDYAKTTPNSNPIVLDSNGEANIYLDDGAYSLHLYDVDEVLLWTLDDVGATAPRIATDAETVAKTLTDVAVSPANLAALLASPGEIGGTAAGVGNFTQVVIGDNQFYEGNDLYSNHVLYIENSIGDAGIVGNVVRKETTGDPTEAHEMMFCVNTVDNTFKIYADGAWQLIKSW